MLGSAGYPIGVLKELGEFVRLHLLEAHETSCGDLLWCGVGQAMNAAVMPGHLDRRRERPARARFPPAVCALPGNHAGRIGTRRQIGHGWRGMWSIVM